MANTEQFYMKNGPLSLTSVKLILGNLFRKESDGGPVEFFIRRLLVPEDEQHLSTYERIKKNIEECGGCLLDNPKGNHSVELAFPETYKDSSEHGWTRYIFSVNYITDCIEQRELLGLEEYRIGEYDPNEVKDANDVMKGFKPWTEIRFSTKSQQGVKLPDFGCPVASSSFLPAPYRSPSRRKARVEYSLNEDYAILNYLISTNSYDKVRGNTIWKEMEKTKGLSNHSYQSLQNRFRRYIQPNINRYTNLKPEERNLIRRCPNANPIDREPESSEMPATSDRMPPTNGTTPSPVRAPAHVTNVAEGSGEPKAGSAQATTLLTSTPHSRSEVKSRDQQLLQPSPILAPPRMAKSTEEPGGLVERPADVATQNKSPYFHPLNEEPRDQQLSEPTTGTQASDLSQSEAAREGITSEITEQSRRTKPADEPIQVPREISIAPSTPEDLSMTDQLRQDRRLLTYLAEHKLFDKVNGSALWENIQGQLFSETNLNWKDAKTRFFKIIVNDIISGKHELDSDSLVQFNKYCLSSPAIAMSGPAYDDANFNSSFISESSSISTFSVKTSSCSTPKKKGNRRKSTTSSRTSTKQSSGLSATTSRREYTLAEDELILKYIIRTGRFNEVRGKILWIDIQDKVLHENGRTWESAKNRYLRTIVRNLSRYRLKEETVEHIKAGLVEDRRLGGSRREPGTSKHFERIKEVMRNEEPKNKKVKRPVEELSTVLEPVKHPAHLPASMREPKSKKRALYKHSALPLTIERPSSSA